MNWLSQSTIHGPSAIQSRPKCAQLHASFLSPSSYTLRPARECQKHVLTAVAILFLSRGPSAVIRAIIAIVVDAVQGLSLWPISHIFVKGSERLSPSVAYANPSSSIVRVCSVVWIAAATDHLAPNAIFGRISHSMRCKSLACHISRQAPATFSISTAQVGGHYDNHVSALASTEPTSNAFVFRARKRLLYEAIERNNSQPAKLLSGQVFVVVSAASRIRISHDRSPKTGLARMARQHQLSGRSHFTL